MRRVPKIMLGVLAVPVGLLPTAALASVVAPAATGAAPAVTAEPTPGPTTTGTAAPSPAPTTAAPAPSSPPPSSPPASPEPSAPPTSEPTPTPTDPEVLTGTFTMSPLAGPAGTVVTISAATKCVDGSGEVLPQVEVVGFDEADINSDLPAFDTTLETDASGGWTTTFTIPASARAGNYYAFIAGCFAAGPIGDESVPGVLYDVQEFAVTAAEKAPVAVPVPGDPTFTG